jgi:hypothetical protein
VKWTFRSQVTGLEDFVFDLNKIQGIREYEGILEDAIIDFLAHLNLREKITKNFTNAFAGDAVGTRLC